MWQLTVAPVAQATWVGTQLPLAVDHTRAPLPPRAPWTHPWIAVAIALVPWHPSRRTYVRKHVREERCRKRGQGQRGRPTVSFAADPCHGLCCKRLWRRVMRRHVTAAVTRVGDSCANPTDRRRWHHVASASCAPGPSATYVDLGSQAAPERTGSRGLRRSTPTSPTLSLSSWRPEATLGPLPLPGHPTGGSPALPPTRGPRGTSGDRHPKTSRSGG